MGLQQQFLTNIGSREQTRGDAKLIKAFCRAMANMQNQRYPSISTGESTSPRSISSIWGSN
jgi:hypothetical protein